MAWDPATWNDIEAYGIGSAGMKRLFSYKVSITSTTSSGLPTQQFVTVNSNNMLYEEQIFGIASSYQSSSKSGWNAGGSVNMEVMSATRSGALG